MEFWGICCGWVFFFFICFYFSWAYFSVHGLSAKRSICCGCSTDPFFGRGHSFHGTGGRGNKLAQMRYSLRVLRSVVAVYNDAVSINLCDQGAISQLLGKAQFVLLFFNCYISVDTRNVPAFLCAVLLVCHSFDCWKTKKNLY